MPGDPAIMINTASRDIPGIYNYCDRWCERCAFTARCRLYKDLDAKGGHDREMSEESAVDMVRASFADMRGQMEAEMRARGIPMPTEAELAAYHRDENIAREQIDNHAVVRLAERYADLVQQWWHTESDLLRGKADSLVARCETMEEPERLVSEARSLLDALQVIEWHFHQIAIKLRRALSSRREGRDGRADANGSAKVALIGMDRSLAAWHAPAVVSRNDDARGRGRDARRVAGGRRT